MHAPARVFVAYSHLDAKYRHELAQQLTLLSRKGQATSWSEHELVPGDEKLEVIEEELQKADIILLLISIHFLSNDFCWSDLLEKAIERHENGDAVVIPVHVRPCPWEDTPVERLQGVPKGAKPIARWTDKHEGWTDAARGIQRSIAAWREGQVENP